MTEMTKTTRKLLEQVESATGLEFEKSIRNFIQFAEQQTNAFDSVLLQELEFQHKQSQLNPHFTGKAEYALICALWERPIAEAVSILLKILAEDSTAPREEIVHIFMQLKDVRAVDSLDAEDTKCKIPPMWVES
jgi:hypothetical protein